jgi:uncharacterized coiled-coil DUF342 family protein
MATSGKAKKMTRTLADNPWLEARDIQDLTDAVRAQTTFLKQSEQRYQHALNHLSEADVITQLVQTMQQVRDATKAVRDELQGMRADLQELHEAFTAKVSNGHDAHAD